MAVLLNTGYAGYLPGTVVNFPSNLETALLAQNSATASVVASTTTGAVTANVSSGIAAIAASSSSVVITNSLVDANTPVIAFVSQAAADATLLRVERVVSAAGSFTIYGTANATATTLVRWVVANTGLSASN